MTGGLREFELDRDAAMLSALLTAVDADPFSVADVHEWLGNDVDGRVFRAMTTTDGIGYAHAFRQTWHKPGQFTCRVVVGESDRRRGLGNRLLDAITRFAVEHGATTQRGDVREIDPAGRAFAESHGFHVVRHFFESTLDPRTVDRALLTRPAPPGVTIASLDELGDTEAHRRMLWQLNERVVQDQPGDIGRGERSYDDFAKQVFESSWFRAAGQFIAICDGSWVGIGAVGYVESTSSLDHMFTGVDAGYRGRGIAHALKRATISYALSVGVNRLDAYNDSTNAPILAINRAYGYVAQPGFFDLERTL